MMLTIFAILAGVIMKYTHRYKVRRKPILPLRPIHLLPTRIQLLLIVGLCVRFL